MSGKVDPREFLLNTDYEMDKIIYFKEGSFTTPHGQYKSITINHNLSFVPLVFGILSFNSDFTNTRTIPFSLSTIAASSTSSCSLDADSTQISLSYLDEPGRFSTTVRYRIYGFEPSNSREKVGATNKYAKNFILNTDYNYCKLYKKGVANSGETITHNLGYIPQTLAWKETTFYGDPIISPIDDSTLSTSEVTINSQKVKFNVPDATKIHYRIYYDAT